MRRYLARQVVLLVGPLLAVMVVAGCSSDDARDAVTTLDRGDGSTGDTRGSGDGGGDRGDSGEGVAAMVGHYMGHGGSLTINADGTASMNTSAGLYGLKRSATFSLESTGATTADGTVLTAKATEIVDFTPHEIESDIVVGSVGHFELREPGVVISGLLWVDYEFCDEEHAAREICGPLDPLLE